LFGKASIVTDTGVYSELPDDCVRKVRPEHELADFTRHLRDLVCNSNLRRCLGEHAQRHADANFGPEIYVSRFLKFCSEVLYCKPTLALIDHAARELRRMGAGSDMQIVDTVARESLLLMDGDYDPPVL